MADIRFSCPACHQHITCDEAWAGHQIQCPVCSQTITVPPKVAGSGAPAAPVSSPAAASLVPKVPQGTRLALNQNAQQPAPTHQKHVPIRNLATPVAKKEGPWKTLGIVAAILAILGAAGYFGWPHVSKILNKKDAPETQAAKPASEQAATEPGAEVPPPADGGAPADPASIVQTGPVIPAVHSLDMAAASIPSGRVNGKVSGGDFLPDTVRIDPLGPTQVLRFSQGDIKSPDRELLIYLRLNPGEKLEGKQIQVAADTRSRGLPQVIKRWRNDPRYAPSMRTFSSGYVLKLDLGKHANGVVKGKIYLALPDKELTVAAGNFTAATTIPVEGIAAPEAIPAGGQPVPGAQPMPAEYEPRYTR